MTLPDFLTRDDGGYIHTVGHRVGLSEVFYFYGQGESPEMLHIRFPTIDLATFYKIIAFFLENQSEVESYCTWHADEMARQRASARPGPNLDELRKRRQAVGIAKGT